jgi:arginine metabolism regulation protein II
MSTALGSNLISGSIDASLAEVDTRSRDPDRSLNHDIVIGPFAVLDFTGSASEHPAEEDSVATQENEPASIDPLPVGDSIDPIIPLEILDSSPVSIIDSLSQMDDFLHWSDLLSFSPDQTGFATHPTLTMPNDLSFDLTNDALLLQNFAQGPEDPMQRMTPRQTPIEMASMETDVSKEAQFLLKHFQDIVIPQIMAIPFGQKSPWKILNLPAAVVAFGDTTFLGTEGISHARLANLYGLLACSAIDLALKPPSDPTQSTEHWLRIANQTYQKAKDHIQTSLQHETQGPKKAKYKDQLMAANILTQYAVSPFTSRCELSRAFADEFRFYPGNNSMLAAF